MRNVEQVNKDIQLFKELLYRKRSGKNYSTSSTAFVFSTENQEGINGILDYQDKSCLTVASSGDQYLAALYYGSNDIQLYDINVNTYYITYLKIASILALSYKEFLNFFIPIYNYDIRESFWNWETFKRVIPFLPSDVAYFWSNVIFELKKERFGNAVLVDYVVNEMDNVFRGMPFYSKEEEYEKLRTKLKSMPYPDIVISDVYGVGSHLDRTYDIVYLSNIVDCLVEKEYVDYNGGSAFYDGDLMASTEAKVYSKVISLINPLLSDGGVMLLSYKSNRFASEFVEPFCSNCTMSAIRPKLLPYDDIFLDGADTDIVFTYCKTKK